MENNQLLNESSEPSEKVYFTTDFSLMKAECQWKIHKFSTLNKKTGEFIKSPSFSDTLKGDSKWCLKLFPKGTETSNKEFISLFLEVTSHANFEQIEAKLQFFILDKNKTKKYRDLIKHTFNHIGVGYGLPELIHLNHLQDYLVDDCLTVGCDVTALLSKHSTNVKRNQIDNFESIQQSKKQCQILSGFESLYNDKKLCDVILITSENKFHAHKTVLAAHSPVFLAMFDDDGTNKELRSRQQIDVIEINDISSIVLTEVLRFIYSRKIENLSSLINDILLVADKYEINVLKDECERYLCNRLTLDNLIDFMILADLYNVPMLKKQAIELLVKDGKLLLEKDNFKNIRNLKSDTFVEITKALLLKI